MTLVLLLDQTNVNWLITSAISFQPGSQCSPDLLSWYVYSHSSRANSELSIVSWSSKWRMFYLLLPMALSLYGWSITSNVVARVSRGEFVWPRHLRIAANDNLIKIERYYAMADGIYGQYGTSYYVRFRVVPFVSFTDTCLLKRLSALTSTITVWCSYTISLGSQT